MNSISIGILTVNIVADTFCTPVIRMKAQSAYMAVNKEHIAFAAVTEVIIISAGRTVKECIY